MAGMIGFGRNIKNQAEHGFAVAADGEAQRNRVNDQIAQAERAEKKQMIGTAGGMGAQYAIAKGMIGGAAAPTAAGVSGAGLTGAGASMVGAAPGSMAAATGATTGAVAGSAATGAAAGTVAGGAGAASAATGLAAIPGWGWAIGGGLLLASLF